MALIAAERGFCVDDELNDVGAGVDDGGELAGFALRQGADVGGPLGDGSPVAEGEFCAVVGEGAEADAASVRGHGVEENGLGFGVEDGDVEREGEAGAHLFLGEVRLAVVAIGEARELGHVEGLRAGEVVVERG